VSCEQDILSLPVRLALAAAILAVGGGVAWWGSHGDRERSSSAEQAERDREARAAAAQHAREQTELRTALDDPVVQSGLAGLALELVPKWTEAGKLALLVVVKKPSGKAWVVESPQHHCVLFIDGVEHGRLGEPPEHPSTLIRMRRVFGDHKYWLPTELELAIGTRLAVEWRQHNPRSGAAEVLRSGEVALSRPEGGR